MSSFDERSEKYVRIINEKAAEYVSQARFTGRSSEGLSVMLEAMSYSLENGGKRIRPLLTLEFCRICGGTPEEALPFALGIEMIHTYSLIHDDLPCMDNDDMRRGKPSNHKTFGYANALLAGDGLLTLAFEVVLGENGLFSEKKAAAGCLLAEAAGCSGMIAGQVMDLANEKKTVGVETLSDTDRLKTGELIRAAAVMGCIAAGANVEMIKAAEKYCSAVGLAFQIVDDILDVTSSETVLGKPIGSDRENGKSTYVSLLGLERARELVAELTSEAKQALNIFGSEGEFLAELADRLSCRKS